MIDRAQILKGLLEGCILHIISIEETYGYKITENLVEKGFKELNEGSVYPILIRLEKKKLICSTLKKSPLGPKRKYFNLTPDGERYLKEFNEVWDEVSLVIGSILKGGK